MRDEIENAQALVDMSKELWSMYHYFMDFTGPYNLERAQSNTTLLYNLATRLDRAIMSSVNIEPPTPQLRRAKSYVQACEAR